MTDDPDLTGDALSPDDEARVRRLLAEAGGPVTTPPAVVARLDATLADLVAARAAGEPDQQLDDQPVDQPVDQPDEGATGAPVTDLARRRRRWPQALLAAAAVVVIGYGLGTTVTGTQGSDDAGSAGGSAADSYESETSSGGDTDSQDLDRPEAAQGLRDGVELYRLGKGTVSFDDSDFEATVRRAARATALANLSAEDSAVRATSPCATPPSTRKDRLVDVRYDGERATLVVGPVRNGMVTASVYGCDGNTLLRLGEVDVD